MVQKKPRKRLKVTPPRAGYDRPFAVYFPEGTLAKLQTKHGNRGIAGAIRALVAEHLAK